MCGNTLTTWTNLAGKLLSTRHRQELQNVLLITSDLLRMPVAALRCNSFTAAIMYRSLSSIAASARLGLNLRFASPLLRSVL